MRAVGGGWLELLIREVARGAGSALTEFTLRLFKEPAAAEVLRRESHCGPCICQCTAAKVETEIVIVVTLVVAGGGVLLFAAGFWCGGRRRAKPVKTAPLRDERFLFDAGGGGN